MPFMPSRNRLFALFAAIVAASAVAGDASPASASPCAAASTPVGRSSRAASEASTLCLINHERNRRGLPVLRWDARLAQAAAWHSEAMVRYGYFGHAGFASRLRSTGYLGSTRGSRATENIAWGRGSRGTPKAIVRGWMRSWPHRRNILGPFQDAGIGITVGAPVRGRSGAATYTANFGRRG